MESSEALHIRSLYFLSFRALPSASADTKSASHSNCEEHRIHGGSIIKSEDKKNLVNGTNVDDEPSTLAICEGDSLRDRVQAESSSACEEFIYEDDEKWKQPWTEEELEHLAITMEDFEVSLFEPAECGYWFCIVTSLSSRLLI